MKPGIEVYKRMQLDSDDTFNKNVSDIEHTVMNLSPQSWQILTQVYCMQIVGKLSELELQKQTFHV